MKIKTPAMFEKETDLCAAFLASVDARRWGAYAETAGWDILLVRKSDGAQIGIEAKLKLNVAVVSQALPDWYSPGEVGPDYRAVLVPSNDVQNGLGRICKALGVTVISWFGDREYLSTKFQPYLPDEAVTPSSSWHQWAPLRRHDVPEYVPDVKAGASAPMALTRWKIQAIRLAIVLEERPITRADFKAVGINAQRWTDPYDGWLKLTPNGYVKGPHFPDFAAQHPKNYEEIKADRARWQWAIPTFSPCQGELVISSEAAP